MDMTENATAPHPLHHPKYRPDVDGLRAVAVLSVVAFHAFPDRLPGGYVGVDIFFVISGFLITTIILKSLSAGSFSFGEFYARRVKRIFPALIVVLVTCYALGWFLLLPDEYKQLGKHISGGAGFISNFLLWKESGYFDSAADSKPLLHLWSLGIEEQFYIVWPLMLFFAWKRRVSLFFVIVAILAASFVLNVLTIGADAVATFYSPATRFWELMVGGALAYRYFHEPPSAANGDFKSVVGLGLIAVAIVALDKHSAFPGWWAALPTIGALLLISSGPGAWVNRRVLSNPVMVWFGLISFPLYLWHWPLLSLLRIAGEPSRETRVGAVLASIALAYITYRLVEKPIRFGRHSTAKVAGLCFLMIGIGLAGYFTYLREGFLWRFPPLIQEVGRFQYDPRKDYREGSCFLRPEQDQTQFGSCLGAARIFLWGDSHAAQLYPGLEKALGKVAQFTKSGCPPLLGADVRGHPLCKAVNDHVFDLIVKHKPDRVIVAGAWAAAGAHDWKLVATTLLELKKAGVRRIDLVGPVPHWKSGLPRTVITYLRRNPVDELPARMTFGLDAKALQIDQEMQAYAARYGVGYVSAIKILCDSAGCLTRTGADVASLTAFDYAHLTAAGSEYLGSRFPR